MKRTPPFFAIVLLASLVLTACQPDGSGAEVTPQASQTGAETGPYRITGSFEYAAVDYVLEQRWHDHAVALVDMYGFVTRDQEWDIPVTSQYLGFMAVDEDANTATYDLFLPEMPAATLTDVDQDGQIDTGVQIFTVTYWPNTYGGIYSEGDDQSSGWPAFLASVKTDEENQYEVIGGKLVVWSPDGEQSFPTGFGEDELLFTEDDPVGAIQTGWTVVDLDQSPFSLIRDAEPVLELYQPEYVAEKDFSELAYTEAFDAMFTFVSKAYAFNGSADKQPDWDALYADLRPRVEAAEANHDAEAFYLALRDFTWAFKDGHVNLSGGDIQSRIFTEATSGGYGFAIRELDDGRVVVVYLSEGGPAEAAGMEIGAEVTDFYGQPIGDAIEAVRPWSIQSMDVHIRYQQARYLLRSQPGTQASVTFANPGSQPRKVTLTAITERDSFAFSSIYRDEPTEVYLPVEYRILESGIGYIAMHTNEDDVSLMIKLFERALQTFEEAGVPGIVIDMRYNSGGIPLGMATFLTDRDIPMGQSYYYSDASGQFEPEGPASFLEPMERIYRFDKMALLVGPACVSACEMEAYGFSQVTGMIVVGMFPSSGAYGEVSRGQILLPEGFYLQVPTGRYVLPDGTLLLEGTGVQPTLKIPINEETIYPAGDILLEYAERAILQPLGAGISPSAPPTFLSKAETEAALSSAPVLEQKAREEYTIEDLMVMDKTFPFTVPLDRSETLLWTWGWCAKDQDTLDDNLGKLRVAFSLNEEDVPADQFLRVDYDSSDGQQCTAYVLGLKDWKSGEHHVITRVTFPSPVNDGTFTYPTGEQVFEYRVYVKQ